MSWLDFPIWKCPDRTPRWSDGPSKKQFNWHDVERSEEPCVLAEPGYQCLKSMDQSPKTRHVKLVFTIAQAITIHQRKGDCQSDNDSVKYDPTVIVLDGT